MFDIGFWELVVIGVVALVVLGPERLPVAIRTASHWIRLIRSTANSVKAELEQELKLQDLHNDLKKAERLQMNNLSPELQESIEQLKAAAQSVNRPYQGENEIRPPREPAQAEPAIPVAASVPAIDWNTRSIGAPRLIASMLVVTCERMHDCVGML